MRIPIKCIIFAALFFLLLGPLYKIDAGSGADFKPVANQTYKETCGACHFVFQPGLLPSGSWSKILADPKNHFSESIDINEDTKNAVIQYLVENAAESSTTDRSLKIMKSLNGQIPSRITDIPYLRRKHREIPPEVFARQAIGSFSHCSACHTTAEQGIYDEANVVIPK